MYLIPQLLTAAPADALRLTGTYSKTKYLKCPASLHVEQKSGSIADGILHIGHLEPNNWGYQEETEGL